MNYILFINREGIRDPHEVKAEKNLLTSVGIAPTTSGLDLRWCRLSYEVAQRKLGTILGGWSRRRESKGTYESA